MKEKAKKILFIIMFWFLSLTWGLPLTIIGLLVTGFCILIGGKPHKNGCSYIVEIGGNWGGLELGPVAICGSYATKCDKARGFGEGCYSPSWFEHTRKHEFGHSATQFIFMGIFYLFIVGIPSASRYWYDRLDKKHKNERDGNWYDSIWFEGLATSGGTYLVDWLEAK